MHPRASDEEFVQRQGEMVLITHAVEILVKVTGKRLRCRAESVTDLGGDE